MKHANSLLLTLAGALIVASCCAAAEPSDPKLDNAGASASASTPAIVAQRAWWTAFVVADTAHLQTSTAPAFSLTLSSGNTYDRAAMLAQAATHTDGAKVGIEWADEAVQFPEPTVAIVSSRVTEMAAGYPSSVYRYLTVLRRFGSDWQVAAAQSTRELRLTPPVPVAVAGTLSDYAGVYRTPKGFNLRIAAGDSRLLLIEPSGKEIPLIPVGPGLFEFERLSMGNGQVRMMFARDASGKVVSFSRLLVGTVNTFTRIE
jgi:hypothetical protein